MRFRAAPWLTLSYDLMRLGLEAQGVIALRMMRLAAELGPARVRSPQGTSRVNPTRDGALAGREARRMITEKAAAAIEAQAAVARAVATGQRGAAVPKKVVRIYRRRVRANRRRLSRHK